MYFSSPLKINNADLPTNTILKSVSEIYLLPDSCFYWKILRHRYHLQLLWTRTFLPPLPGAGTDRRSLAQTHTTFSGSTSTHTLVGFPKHRHSLSVPLVSLSGSQPSDLPHGHCYSLAGPALCSLQTCNTHKLVPQVPYTGRSPRYQQGSSARLILLPRPKGPALADWSSLKFGGEFTRIPHAHPVWGRSPGSWHQVHRLWPAVPHQPPVLSPSLMVPPAAGFGDTHCSHPHSWRLKTWLQ